MCAVLALPFWFVEIHTAFGLPAHPLILHLPVIFVPLLGLAALATAMRPALMTATAPRSACSPWSPWPPPLLTAGAGEAFADSRRGPPSHLLHQHAEAGQTLRLFVIGLTAVLVAWMLGRHRLEANRRARLPLQLLTVVLALGSIYFVLRAGHRCRLAWAHDH